MLREAHAEMADEEARRAEAQERAEGATFAAAREGHQGPRSVAEILAAAEAEITVSERTADVRVALGIDPPTAVEVMAPARAGPPLPGGAAGEGGEGGEAGEAQRHHGDR